jgi:hypothetical protein
MADKGAWPTDATDVMGNVSGKYTSKITISTGAGLTTTTAVITAEIRTTGVNSAITGGLLTLTTSDAGKNWTCATGAGLAAKYVPSSCR